MKLCFYGNPLLIQPEHLEIVDLSLPAAWEDVRMRMERLLVRCGFRGIAAPQVGISAQLVVVRLEDGRVLDLVNPKITRMHGIEAEYAESCISCPPRGNKCKVPRMQIITVEAASVNSPEVREWRFKGEDSRVIQHEIDHLTGTWFFDRADFRARETVLQGFKDWQRKWASNGREFPY